MRRLLILVAAVLIRSSLCQQHPPPRRRPSRSKPRQANAHQQSAYRQHDDGYESNPESERYEKASDDFSDFDESEDDTHEQQKEQNGFWQDDKTSTAISTIFKRTKPRGLIHGAWKASQSTALGFAVGMTCLITFPSTSLILAGLSFKPLILSAILGSVTGMGAVGFGIWNGLHNCYWGIMQSPKSIQSWWTGSVWNPEDGNWGVYDLHQHKQELIQQHERQYLDGGFTDSGNFYQILDVPVSASKSEIKKAYHQKAKMWHPDKNPDVDKAEMFLQLHAAYLTLSDDAKRTIYDEVGEQDVSSTPIDPRVFFSILYDSFSVKSYTGDLAISTWASQIVNLGVFANGNEDDPQRNVQKLIQLVADMQRKDQKRQVDIAFHLRDSIEPFTSGKLSELEFREWCHDHAHSILNQGMFQDPRILSVVGHVLESSAHYFRGWPLLGWPRGIALWSRRSVNKLSNKFQFYRGIFWMVKFLFRYMDVFKKNAAGGLESTAGLMKEHDEILPAVLKLLWSYNMLDIESTVDGACWKLFRDGGVSKHERSLRARAVEILGQEFGKVAKSQSTFFASDPPSSNSEEAWRKDPLLRVEIALVMAQDQCHGESPAKIRSKVKDFLEDRAAQDKNSN
eukprot:scaffold2619_cov129-Cylindrotheca_fusiformis.AAC.8